MCPALDADEPSSFIIEVSGLLFIQVRLKISDSWVRSSSMFIYWESLTEESLTKHFKPLSICLPLSLSLCLSLSLSLSVCVSVSVCVISNNMLVCAKIWDRPFDVLWLNSSQTYWSKSSLGSAERLSLELLFYPSFFSENITTRLLPSSPLVLSEDIQLFSEAD